MKKIISILSLCLIFSFTSLYAEVDGYKDLKFGMNPDKVTEIMKRECLKPGGVVEYVMDPKIHLQQPKKCYSLMGEKRDLELEYYEKKLVFINVTPISDSLGTLEKGLKKKYKVFIDTNLGATKVLVFEGGHIMYTNFESKIQLIYLEKNYSKKFLVEQGLAGFIPAEAKSDDF